MTKVTIYSTPTCPYCKQEKDFLKEKGVNFEDIDVAAEPDKASEMVDKSGQMGVPVTVIAKDGGKEGVIVGFDRNKLEKLLNL